MARITHLPHRHAATLSRVASPITRVFASCPELILVRPRTRHGPRVDTNDSHDTPPECRTLTDQVRGFTGFSVKIWSNMLYYLSRGPNNIMQWHKYMQHNINVSQSCYTPRAAARRYNSISFTNINHYHIIIYLNAQPSNASTNTLVLQALVAHTTIITHNRDSPQHLDESFGLETILSRGRLHFKLLSENSRALEI